MANIKGHRRGWGSVRQRTSGRWQARYTGPDRRLYSALSTGGSGTFDTKAGAEAALARVRVAIDAKAWIPPDAPGPVPGVTFEEYAAGWIAGADIAERTREHYEQILSDHIDPTFGAMEVAEITPSAVRAWYRTLNPKTPTARAHAYGLLRTIMTVALSEELILANPCRIKGAGQVKRARKIRPASLAELEAVVKALPERYRLMALLAAWCALRFGELAELRRGDVEIAERDGVRSGVLRVSRGVVRTKREPRLVKDPKSEAGKRPVAIPPHLLPAVEDHLRTIGRAKAALLFPSATDPGKQMAHSALNKVWLRARAKAGREDLAFHDLRHTGAVLAAATGATLAELMARLGHSTPAAAMRYQHAAADRDRVIADALSELARKHEDG